MLFRSVSQSRYKLVSLKQNLTEAFQLSDTRQTIEELIRRVEDVKFKDPSVGSEHVDYINNTVAHLRNFLFSLGDREAEYQQQLLNINQKIDSITHTLFYNNYELEEKYGTADFVRTNRRISLGADIEQDVKTRILNYTNWRYPALEIGCRDGEWTQFMVAADPLYIMDRHQEFLDAAKNQFPSAYQRRLRTYQMINHDLSVLPQNQCGFHIEFCR